MLNLSPARLFTGATVILTLALPNVASAYGEKDAIRDCEKRIRSEYKLSDTRDTSAQKLQDVDHHYKVSGKTKVDGEKYPWTCEVKERHVTGIDYSGPEPEGMGTAEKLAIGAAAVVATGLAVNAMTKDKETEAPAPAPVKGPEIKSGPNGTTEVVLASGCSVFFNDMGFLENKSGTCTDADVSAARKALNTHKSDSK